MSVLAELCTISCATVALILSFKARRCEADLLVTDMIQSQVNGLLSQSRCAVMSGDICIHGKYGRSWLRNVARHSSACNDVGSAGVEIAAGDRLVGSETFVS
jgi:hypothetical protein